MEMSPLLCLLAALLRQIRLQRVSCWHGNATGLSLAKSGMHLLQE